MPPLAEFQRMYSDGGAAWDELTLRKSWREAVKNGEVQPFTRFDNYRQAADYIRSNAPDLPQGYGGDFDAAVRGVVNQAFESGAGIADAVDRLRIGGNIDSSVGVGDNGSARQGVESDIGGEIKVSDQQFGKKVGKHAEDFGLDPSNPESRNIIRNRINEIFNDATEIRQGEWMGLGEQLPNSMYAPGQARFYILGEDVVVTDMNGNFVTIMKGGINNLRVKAATRVWSLWP